MPEAQYALGMLYLGAGHVEGMREDVSKGLHWIRKAASKDHGVCRVVRASGLCVHRIPPAACPQQLLSGVEPLFAARVLGGAWRWRGVPCRGVSALQPACPRVFAHARPRCHGYASELESAMRTLDPTPSRKRRDSVRAPAWAP